MSLLGPDNCQTECQTTLKTKVTCQHMKSEICANLPYHPSWNPSLCSLPHPTHCTPISNMFNTQRNCPLHPNSTEHFLSPGLVQETHSCQGDLIILSISRTLGAPRSLQGRDGFQTHRVTACHTGPWPAPSHCFLGSRCPFRGQGRGAGRGPAAWG